MKKEECKPYIPEISGLMRQAGSGRLETQFAIQCAPMVTGIKISNLFIVSKSQADEVENAFAGTDIECFYMYTKRNRTTFFLYREKQVAQYLENAEISKCMRDFGYQNADLREILSILRERCVKCVEEGAPFPHELGLLLGYPMEDVRGFIENKGQNYLYSGYWKVYANLPEKKKLFSQFEMARAAVGEMVLRGKTIFDIASVYSCRQ